MVTIGDTTLPGVQTTVTSSRSSGVGIGSPGNALLIGPADSESATGEMNKVYEIRSPARAKEFFGPDSTLAENVIDAMIEGAFPVYAMAPEEVSVEGETASSSGTVANAPMAEQADAIEFVADNEVQTTVITFKDPSQEVPGTGEALVNPVTGEYNLDVSTATVTVDYVYHDYAGAIDAIDKESASKVDFLAPLTENEDVVSVALSEAKLHAQNYDFMIVLAGVAPWMGYDEIDQFVNANDTSRLQYIYPSRTADGDSVIGSYVGLRSDLGISASPMKRRFSQSDLIYTLSKDEMVMLLSERVNPISNESAGARVVEDVTSVTDENAEEAEMKQGIARLIIDYVSLVVRDNSEQFISELHTQAARNSLQNMIRSELKDLVELNAVRAYSISVQEIDSMTASVDVGVSTAKPLRNIIATVQAGDVAGASA